MGKTTALKKKADDKLALTTVEDFFVTGDLSKVAPTQRFNLYVDLCRSLQLNPLTQPFGYISIEGRMCLYSKKDCAEQLRKIHGVSITSLEREWITDTLLAVNVTGKDRNGKVDAATGVLECSGKDGKKLTGQNLGNAIMKCETKAKRRLTLSICGLSMPDETEIADIATAKIETKMEEATKENIAKIKPDKKLKNVTPAKEEAKPEVPIQPPPTEKEKPIEQIIKALPQDVKDLLKVTNHKTMVEAARVYRQMEGDIDAMRQLLEAEKKRQDRAGA